jgi:hypothetical protein
MASGANNRTSMAALSRIEVRRPGIPRSEMLCFNVVSRRMAIDPILFGKNM